VNPLLDPTHAALTPRAFVHRFFSFHSHTTSTLFNSKFNRIRSDRALELQRRCWGWKFKNVPLVCALMCCLIKRYATSVDGAKTHVEGRVRAQGSGSGRVEQAFDAAV
jgi:hypothetical protein